MKKVCLFLAPGFEECEAITAVDLLRRAGIEVTTAAVSSVTTVSGSHGVPVKADARINDLDLAGFDLLILPGGIPGTPNLKASPLVASALQGQVRAGKRVAAICAGPTVLGELGLLDGMRATCYPGCEDGLGGATYDPQPVVTDSYVTTATGVGTAIPFALELISLLEGPEKAQEIGRQVLYQE